MSDLAAELGVSRRTLLRDLASLRDRGLAIAGAAGPGGGVRLDGDRGQAAVHLSIPEIVALWLGARLSRGAGLAVGAKPLIPAWPSCWAACQQKTRAL